MRLLPVAAAAVTVIGTAILVAGFQVAERTYRLYERRRHDAGSATSTRFVDGLRGLALSSIVTVPSKPLTDVRS